MRTQLSIKFADIASVENLLAAWEEFLKGKRKKKDVQEFQFRLMDNILSLGKDLDVGTYRHGGYKHFKITDPKPRDIHKASVRDRLLHHAIYRNLYPFFDRAFIADSYSCRNGRGTHAAIQRFQKFSRIVSRNNTHTCWVLKCDIKKFFANIDHQILIEIISQYTTDPKLILLLKKIIASFSSPERQSVGLPLGNLTSQLFVNIYMNEFDQFIKHHLRVKHYIRYADDFVIFSPNKEWLKIILPEISNFLFNQLKLELHPKKVFVATLVSGIDFLGWIHFPDHRVLRTATKQRIFKRLKDNPKEEIIQSYRGLLSHGNAQKLASRFAKSESYATIDP